MKTVIFACVHSAGRSQMAAAWFNQLAHPETARALAAGTQPTDRVHLVVVDVMKEVGIDLSREKPQLLTAELVTRASWLITMGCDEGCPLALPGTGRLDWELEDPKGKPAERVREIRDLIKRRVLQLIEGEGWGR